MRQKEVENTRDKKLIVVTSEEFAPYIEIEMNGKIMEDVIILKVQEVVSVRMDGRKKTSE